MIHWGKYCNVSQRNYDSIIATEEEEIFFQNYLEGKLLNKLESLVTVMLLQSNLLQSLGLFM